MSYSRVVWVENGKEYEEVIPSKWVQYGTHVRLPKKNLKRKIAECSESHKSWLKYKLKKIKMQGALSQCNESMSSSTECETTDKCKQAQAVSIGTYPQYPVFCDDAETRQVQDVLPIGEQEEPHDGDPDDAQAGKDEEQQQLLGIPESNEECGDHNYEMSGDLENYEEVSGDADKAYENNYDEVSGDADNVSENNDEVLGDDGDNAEDNSENNYEEVSGEVDNANNRERNMSGGAHNNDEDTSGDAESDAETGDGDILQLKPTVRDASSSGAGIKLTKVLEKRPVLKVASNLNTSNKHTNETGPTPPAVPRHCSLAFGRTTHYGLTVRRAQQRSSGASGPKVQMERNGPKRLLIAQKTPHHSSPVASVPTARMKGNGPTTRIPLASSSPATVPMAHVKECRPTMKRVVPDSSPASGPTARMKDYGLTAGRVPPYSSPASGSRPPTRVNDCGLTPGTVPQRSSPTSKPQAPMRDCGSAPRSSASLYPLPEEVFQRKVLTLLKAMQMELRELQATSSSSSFNYAVERPCDSVEEVYELDRKLGSPDFRKALVDQLRRAGGGDVKELTDNILSKLLTNNAASFYNLDGRKGMNCLVNKKAFCKLSIYRVVEEAIMAQLPSATVKNIRERVGRYLIGAPGRKGGIGRHSSNDLN